MKCSDTLTSVESLSLLDEKIAKFNEVVLFLKLSVIYKKECVQGTFDGPPVVDESESKGREGQREGQT